MATYIALDEIVLDWNLYPRHEVDSMQVTRLVEAIEAGETLPPLVLDRESKRIVDGFHRYHAYKRVKAETVAAELRAYDSEAAIFLASVTHNARHGVPLSPQDQARVLLLGDHLSITKEHLAEALAIRTTRLAAIERTRFGTTERGGKVYLRPPIRHFAGGEVPAEVVKIADSLGGNTADFYIRQLLMLLRSGGIDMNEATVALLKELRAEIDAALPMAMVA